MNQDPLGKQSAKVRDDGDFEAWSTQFGDGSRAVVLLGTRVLFSVLFIVFG